MACRKPTTSPQLQLFPASRVCTVCQVEQPLDAFRKHKSGHRSQCLLCCAAYGRGRRLTWTPEQRAVALERSREYHRTQPPVVTPPGARKRCSRCGLTKSVDAFSPHARGIFGRQSKCKPCLSAVACARYWALSPADRPRRDPAQKAQWLNAMTPQARAAQQARDRAAKRRWFSEHPDYIAKYNARRVRADPDFALRILLRRRVQMALKHVGAKKAAKTMDLIGCSIADLRRHLEQQFRPGMSWKTYGYRGWHVDHIRPCAAFDLRDPEQQLACFHYTNMQPLWAHENHTKSAKIL